jgi:hypothetical protein
MRDGKALPQKAKATEKLHHPGKTPLWYMHFDAIEYTPAVQAQSQGGRD